MSDRPQEGESLEQELDPDFADFLADVATSHGQTVAPPRPEFGDVLRRAQSLDPSAVPAEMLEQAAQLAAVVPLASHRSSSSLVSSDPDPELDEFLEDVKAHNEGIAAERRLGGIPALAETQRPSTRAPQIAALISVAAALVLLFVSTPTLFTSTAGTQTTSQALMPWTVDQTTEAQTRATQASPARGDHRGGDTGRENQETADEPTPPAAETGETPADASADANADADDLVAAAGKPKVRRPKVTEEELADELKALDDAAQEAWRKGDLARAKRSFRALIRRDPRGRWAQLAYGDLFTLARQRGEPKAELALWREYLKKHPKGPHADDAQAGLCRRSPSGERAACWKDYLDAHPRGAYRQQAEAAQAKDIPPVDEP